MCIEKLVILLHGVYHSVIKTIRDVSGRIIRAEGKEFQLIVETKLCSTYTFVSRVGLPLHSVESLCKEPNL